MTPSWKHVQDLAFQWVLSEDFRREVRCQYDALPLLHKRTFDSVEAYERHCSTQRLQPLRDALALFEARCPFPVRRVAGAFVSYQFAHKSFFEYFCARLILLAAGSPKTSLDVCVTRVARVLSTKRRIQVGGGWWLCGLCGCGGCGVCGWV